MEDGSEARQAGPQSRRRIVEQPCHLGHRLRHARDRDRQGDRPDRLGQEPVRPGRSGADRRAAFDAATGKITWHFQYTPNDNRDYDETGAHILIDTKVNGEDRKLVAHPGRNGFNYVLDRLNGQFLKATQHVKVVSWTKGIDPKTGKPVDYEPSKEVQTYAEGAGTVADKASRQICPSIAGGTNFWPASYSRKTGNLYIPAYEGCGTVTVDTSMHVKGRFNGGSPGQAGAITSSITMVDPSTGELKKRAEFPYPNSSGVLSTAGGIVMTGFLDGTLVALDDQTLDELWRFNVGSGFNVPPMTYAVSGKQYIAVSSGLCCVRPSGQISNSLATKGRNPELRDQSNVTVLYVFGL